LISQELERLAADKAREAVQLDSQGLRSRAIARYQEAIELLLKLQSFCENPRIRQVYLDNAEKYQARIQQLREGRGEIASQEEERPGFEELVLSEKPDISWSDVADLQQAKIAIKESIVYPFKRPDLYPLGWPRGILLFGPPGCGKTLVAAAVAAEINATFYYVDAASVMSKWLGESEKNIARLFSSAREASMHRNPSIIFIDEIDSLAAAHRLEVGGESRARNQLLKEMDGLREKGKSLHLYVLGATNRPWELDEPFIRRFQKRIYVPLPEASSRLEMFKLYTRDLTMSPGVDLEQLARMTEYYSGNDIHDLCMAVQIAVVRELFETEPPQADGKPRPITMDDFLQSMRKRGSSVSLENVKRIENWFTRYGAQ